MPLPALRLAPWERHVDVKMLNFQDTEGESACIERILLADERLEGVRLNAKNLKVNVLHVRCAQQQVAHRTADHQRTTARLPDSRGDVPHRRQNVRGQNAETQLHVHVTGRTETPQALAWQHNRRTYRRPCHP